MASSDDEKVKGGGTLEASAGPGRGFWREAAFHGVLLVAMLALFFPAVFFRGEQLSSADHLFNLDAWRPYAPEGWERPRNPLVSDPVYAFLPDYAAVQEALDEGVWPLWNPYELGGVPLLANFQSAVFYPPRLLQAFFNLHVAATLSILLKLWLCGMTAYGCGRGIGLSRSGARFLSLGWMLSNYNLLWAYWPLVDVSVWLPVLSLGAERLLQAHYRQGIFTMATGATLILLAGHPESAFAMSLGVGVYFVLRLLLERRWGQALWRPVLGAAGAWGLALAVCAVQILPFLEYLSLSDTFLNRTASSESLFSLPPASLAAWWVPRLFGTEADGTYWGTDGGFSYTYMTIYPGLAVWIAVALLCARGEVRAAHRARLAALLVAAGFSALLAYDAPLIGWLNRLPVMRSMYVSHHAAFVCFALPVIGAVGFEHWFSCARSGREIGPVGILAAAAAVTVSLTLFIVWPMARFAETTGYAFRQVGVSSGLFVLALVPVLGHAVRPRRALWGAALTAALVLQMWVSTRGLNPALERRFIFPETALTRCLSSFGKPARIGTAEANLPSGAFPAYGIEEVFGYDGLFPHRFMEWHRRVSPETRDRLEPMRAIDYYLYNPRYPMLLPLDTHPERYERVAEADGIEIYRNKSALPRAFLVPRVRVAEGPDALLAVMAGETFDPAREALLEHPAAVPLSPDDGGAAGSAEVTEYASTEVTVTVDARRDAVLVLADAYYPGWKARVNGEDAELFPVDYLWRGVRVSEGKSTVEYRYDPVSFRAGLWISTVGCCASLVAAVVGRLRRRPSAAS